MKLFKSQNLSDLIEDLLDREQQAALAGNLEALARIIPEKTRLMRQISQMTHRLKRLDHLQTKARRNQELLVAVSQGIKSASNHLAGLQKKKLPLRTYDALGSSQEILQRRSVLEKRA